MRAGSSSSRVLRWLFDTSVTALVFAAGVALLVSLAHTRSVLTWAALGRAFGAFLAFLVVAARIPASLRRSPGRHVVDTIDSQGEDLRERGLLEGPFEEIVWSGPGINQVRRR